MCLSFFLPQIVCCLFNVAHFFSFLFQLLSQFYDPSLGKGKLTLYLSLMAYLFSSLSLEALNRSLSTFSSFITLKQLEERLLQFFFQFGLRPSGQHRAWIPPLSFHKGFGQPTPRPHTLLGWPRNL